MQNRRDVGWVGGLQHGSIFNQKKKKKSGECSVMQIQKVKVFRNWKRQIREKEKGGCPLAEERRGMG